MSTELQNQNAVFNLADFEAADTAVLEVTDRKGDPLLYNGQPVTIELYSPGSSEYLRATHKVATAQQTATFAAIRGKPIKETVEGNIHKQAEKLAACTASVRNFPVAAFDIYANPKLGYITNQVAKFIEDWANF
jgi:hypothetical protein